ncbi:MAG: radical SAM protein [Burkholderiales bacterium]|nr:radical SAM protein [Burkholderiales bacterium]
MSRATTSVASNQASPCLVTTSRADSPAQPQRPTSLSLFEVDVSGLVRRQPRSTPPARRERRWPEAPRRQVLTAEEPLPGTGATAGASYGALPGMATGSKLADLALAQLERPAIKLIDESCTSLLRVNDSIDLPYPLSINPYRGCEHGCSFCPVALGPFGTRRATSADAAVEATLIDVYAKRNAADRLRLELRRPGYRPRPICLGSAADAYQPVERRLRLTRGLIEVLAEARHPFGLATRSAGVVRDLDLFEPLAELGLVLVLVSLATLDDALSARLEPGASTPTQRLAAMRTLSRAGVWVGLNLAPLQPGVNDGEVEALAGAAAQAGARALRWRGRLADEAAQADMLARLDTARTDHGLAADLPPLDCSRFLPPQAPEPPADRARGQRLLF